MTQTFDFLEDDTEALRQLRLRQKTEFLPPEMGVTRMYPMAEIMADFIDMQPVLSTQEEDYDSDEFKAETYAMGKYNFYVYPDLFMLAFNERLQVLKDANKKLQ